MSDNELWNAFVTQSISHRDWTHRAHVRIAYLHTTKYGFAESLRRLRQRIQKLNAVHGVQEAIDRGYHETLTQAFLRLITAAAARTKPTPSEDFCDRHPELMSKRIVLTYYTRDLIMSAEAKATFIEPDLQALPEMP